MLISAAALLAHTRIHPMARSARRWRRIFAAVAYTFVQFARSKELHHEPAQRQTLARAAA
jgi:hypothetical protein